MAQKALSLPMRLAKRARYWATPFLERMPDACFPTRSRRLHGYCFGMPKTGAAPVIAGMFHPQFRAAHEPEIRFFSYRVLAYRRGQYPLRDLERYLRKRDRRLQLEMESSYLNGEIVEVLVHLFPDAKFILTIQDCFSWLELFIYLQLMLKSPSRWSLTRDRVKLSHLTGYARLYSEEYFDHYDAAETPLRDLGLLPLDACFAYWQRHNERILRAVPEERLLVLRAEEIAHSGHVLEDFFALPANALSAPCRAPPLDMPTRPLESIPRSFIWNKARAHCDRVMQRFYPEIWRTGIT